jgi:uncharacterized protein with PIN domain
MVTYVLDASAILRYLDNEAGADRVAAIIKAHIGGEARVIVSDIHWGEVVGIVYKRHGADMMEKVISRLDAFGLESAAVTESGPSVLLSSKYRHGFRMPMRWEWNWLPIQASTFLLAPISMQSRLKIACGLSFCQ